jgi:hypothetical protein
MDQCQEVARVLRKRSRSVSRSSEINGGNLATEWTTRCLSKTMKSTIDREPPFLCQSKLSILLTAVGTLSQIFMQPWSTKSLFARGRPEGFDDRAASLSPQRQLKGGVERRPDEAYVEVSWHSEPMLEYRRGRS